MHASPGEDRTRIKSLSALRIILSAMAIASFFYGFVFDLVLVRGTSMESSIHPGSIIVILRCAYGVRLPWASAYLLRWATPAFGDVVVVRRGISGSHDAVKRVFESGPSFLRVERGIIYGSDGSGAPKGRVLDGDSPLNQVREVYVPPESVFVLGDNDPDSYDSRNYGSVPVENIRGKVLFLRGNEEP